MIRATTILLLLFLGSCTITKRVHRPGYHIEWRKQYKAQKAPKPFKEEKQPTNSEELTLDPMQVRSSEVASGNEETLQRLVKIPETRSQDVLDVKATSQESGVETKSKRKIITQHRKYAPFEKLISRKKQKEKRSGRGMYELQTFGYVLLGFSAFLLVGCFFAYFGLWALESLFYNLVFSGNGIIAGIVGFFIFLIVVLLVFLAFAVVEYLMGSYIVGLIVAGIAAAVGGLCLLIADNF